MANINDISYNSGFQTFNFRDEDGELITSGLMARCEEVQEFFVSEKDFLEKADTPQKMLEVNNKIEQKIDYLLNTENDSVFKKPLTATTVMPDGMLFAELLINTVLDAIKPEIAKRAKAKKDRLAKYTAKYE